MKRPPSDGLCTPCVHPVYTPKLTGCTHANLLYRKDLRTLCTPVNSKSPQKILRADYPYTTNNMIYSIKGVHTVHKLYKLFRYKGLECVHPCKNGMYTGCTQCTQELIIIAGMAS